MDKQLLEQEAKMWVSENWKPTRVAAYIAGATSSSTVKELERENAELKEFLRQIDKSLYIGKDLDDIEILKFYVDVVCVVKEEIQDLLNSDMVTNGASQEKQHSSNGDGKQNNL